MIRFGMLCFSLLFTLSALAQEKNDKKPVEQIGKSIPSSIPVEPETEDLPAPAKSDKVDLADQKITNRRMRADSGSLSKWSGAMFFNYQGGSLANPTKPERPNIVNGRDALTLTSFKGEIGIRYRMTKLDSISASTGLFMTTPFHDSIDTDNAKLQKNFDENHQKLTVADPFLKYAHVDKFWGLQSVSNIKPTLITNSQQKSAGYSSSLYLSENMMKDIGSTGLSVGAMVSGTVYAFNNSNQNLTSNVVGLYPNLEYVINDTFNFRTTFGFQVYEQYRSMDSGTWVKRKVYQSVGFGISLSRDVFLYPNVQYIPSDIRADRTNIAMSANINVF